MCLLKSVVFCVLCAQVTGSSNLVPLLRRIKAESGLATVHVLGHDKAFFDNFTGFGSDISMIVLTSDGSSFHHNSIVVVPVLSGYNAWKLISHSHLQFIRIRKFVIIVASSFYDFHEPFTFFHKNKFSRIFGAVNETFYAYLPFERTPIQRIPGDGPLPQAYGNLNGFPIRSDIISNFPRVFWFPERPGRYRLGGPYGHVIEELVRKCNATLKEVDISHGQKVPSAHAVLGALRNSTIDITTRGLTGHPSYHTTYPLKVQKWGVVVPVKDVVPPSELFIRPFTPVAWLSIGIAVLYCILMDYAKDAITDARKSVWKSFARIFLIFAGRSPQPAIASAYRFYILVMVLAFILNNLYIIFFFNYLTVPIKGKHYNKIHDLVDSKINILCSEDDQDFVKNLNYSEAFERLLIPIDRDTFAEILNTMGNTNFPFLVSGDYTNFLMRMQRFFTESRFYETQDGLLSYGLAFPISDNSPYKEIIDRIILQVAGCGLLEKWERRVITEAIKGGHRFQQSLKNTGKGPSALNLADLYFGWCCLLVGCSVALIAFIFEVGFSMLHRSKIFRGVFSKQMLLWHRQRASIN